MAHEHHTASGRMRTREEVLKEIAEREELIRRLQVEMRDLHPHGAVWQAKMQSINTHTSVKAVLRWVLGEDLLWE